MRRILICTGILGGGAALTFAAAALAATLLPGGQVVPVSPWGGGLLERGGGVRGGPMPVPAPDIVIAVPDNVELATPEP
jgi:uncharacterized SAM-binding protein YcdF (DUF218 family)